MIEEKRWSALQKRLSEMAAPEMADLLLETDRPEMVILYRLLPRDVATEVFSYLEADDQYLLLKELTADEHRKLLANLKPDDRTYLLQELPGRVTQKMLNLLSPDDLEEARNLLGYPEESVGRLMTPDYLAVRKGWTARQALKHIRRKGRQSETVNVLYVVNSGWKLIGIVELWQLILADPSTIVSEIMKESFIALTAFDDREKAVQTMQKYDLLVLPVVDSDGVLLGIVTIDDVLDVAQEETTEDFQKTASVTPLGISYQRAGILTLYSKRIIWLLGLILLNLISSGVISAYEETLASAIALTFFIPLLIDTGGNTGAQSATLIVRALVTGEVNLGDWVKTILKELGVGALLGVTLGLAGWGLGIFRGGYRIGLVVGLTMFSIVLVTNIVGMLLPFVLSKLRIDPAVASSPLITSVADASGLIIYFTIATRILGT